MIDTRLLGSGALSAMALLLAAAATPASAAAQLTPDMMLAPDTGPSPISAPAAAPAPTVALQERGRGGGGRRGEGARTMRSGNTGSWNGAQSRASGGGERGGGRSWGGGSMAPRQVETGSAAAPRAGGSYDRGARGYRGNGGGYAGNGGGYNAPATAQTYGSAERGRREGRAGFANNRAAIDRGDIQAPPSYGEGNRTGAASPYIRNDNLAAQGVAVAGAAGRGADAGNLSDRRGGGGRNEWSGNRGGVRGDGRGDLRGRGGVNAPGDIRGGGRGDNWRGDVRGGGRGANWADGRRDNWRGDRRDGWRGNDWRGNRNDWRGQRQAGFNQGFRAGVRWDRGWRDNRRFNWIGHRQANRFLFAPGPYFSPFAGHFYRPVSIGFLLDPLFFQPRFFLSDPWAFRLPPAGDRFRWVRYYDDVLLVDVFSGEVVDVIENFFWQ